MINIKQYEFVLEIETYQQSFEHELTKTLFKIK